MTPPEKVNTQSYNEVQDGAGAQHQREGRIARSIEQLTSKLPSDVFLWAAGAAMLGSLASEIMGPKPVSMFGRKIPGRATRAMQEATACRGSHGSGRASRSRGAARPCGTPRVISS